jgi:hypothetical protein
MRRGEQQYESSFSAEYTRKDVAPMIRSRTLKGDKT